MGRNILEKSILGKGNSTCNSGAETSQGTCEERGEGQGQVSKELSYKTPEVKEVGRAIHMGS